jgi:hypothetical protein
MKLNFNKIHQDLILVIFSSLLYLKYFSQYNTLNLPHNHLNLNQVNLEHHFLLFEI